MKNRRYIKTFLILFLLFGITQNNVVFAQKIDVDSLLTVAIREVNKDKNYEAALKKTTLGMKLAPDYLDFHLLTGRIYQLTNVKDSARYYYNYVINKNPICEDAFGYLINMDIEEKKYSEALIMVNKAIEAHPGNKDFRYKKLSIYELQGEKEKSEAYLKEMQAMYPKDSDFKLHYFIADSRLKSDRIGINYNYTSFNRSGYGPWHFGSLQYIRQRDWGSAIARVNYSNRYADGQSIVNGIQYEAETYLFTNKKSYSYIGGGYSSDPVFPKLRLGYSFFHNFNKGWEGDLGLRYIDSDQTNFTTAVVGVGKYLGSYWINLRSYLQFDNSTIYPAFTLTSRYYFNTRFDYLTLIAGYGTSPDERTTLGQIQERLSLDSFRIGGGYYRLFGEHYITGLQLSVNNQEYAPGLKQIETEIAMMFQYQF
ncbi:YaiO family outer membrane beta-barrel protein [Flavobacterium taihuense]|uniref:YaiO family outer membrane beta-barrel protein n=1 Tax=Flavobacterium taihuense TaxID=2857508 RepID=A0ABS6XTU7_9FLAO|nr:YaiO family outer membrane beta-barrel protein [Flavobacterium taihuense]MBW4360081.1 YaiO family outer membrane beta-barrel protein [Flavobacterium taihuense]